MLPPLYKRIGGGSTVASTVVKLYDKILNDPLLAPFFANVDVETIRRFQVTFVSMAFGGPHRYSGQDLREVHARPRAMGLSDPHFDRVLFHLETAMKEQRIAADMIAKAMTVIEKTRVNILNRPTA